MCSQYFKQLIGEKLSAVVFVLDYHQLQFDGFGFSVLNPITVAFNGSTVTIGDDQFRNRLCDQITKIVVQVEYIENDSLVIEFADGSTISISLKVEDYCGPEAIIFNGPDKLCVVI